jgi:tRNA G18 (ribose-2'-O)-methylase SpoU
MGRGYFGIGIVHVKKEHNVGTLLRTAQSLGAAFVFTVGRRYDRQASDTTKAWRHIPLYHHDTIDQLVDSLPYSCPLIGVELDPRARPISNYVHPERAVYLLGAEDHGLTPSERARCHQLVQLPGAYCLNVATAGSIVMFDRVQKMEQRRVA